MVIFVSSIGRSGTRYLADLSSHCTDVATRHDAEPLCHSYVMVDVYSDLPRDEVRQKANLVTAEAALATHTSNRHKIFRASSQNYLSTSANSL
jgi:hypothetical protein